MFKSNQYLGLATLVGFIAIVALMLFYRHLAFTSLMDHETRSNVALAKALSNAIWSQYAGFVRSAHQIEPARLAQAAEIMHLDADVRKQMRDSNVIKVKIYDLNGLTVYSSDPGQIGDDKSRNSGFLSAKGGVAASNITFRNNFDGFDGVIVDRNVVSSYIPVYDPAREGVIDAVFEVYSDVTPLIRTLEHTQWRVVIGVLSSVSLVYAFLVFVAVRADIAAKRHESEKRSNETYLHYQAYHDDLTGLANRNSFNGYLPQAISRVGRNGAALGVLFLDLDNFKLINDSVGHDAGNELLRVVVQRLRGCIRESDFLFRMEGDEFAIISENLQYPEGAVRLAKKLLRAIQEPVDIRGHSIVVTASIGISVYPKDALLADKLAKNACAAMYLAKEAGHSQYRFYAPEMNDRALERLEFESALSQALKRGEYRLHYQPRFAADSHTIVGLEALLRWQRADGQLETPDKFISALEQSGLINPVGGWVLHTACQQNKAWQDEGLPGVRVSVNISPCQFLAGDFIALVQDALQRSGLAPEYLELELTESVLLDDSDRIIRLMQKIKALGVSISIDDFGTGYSSFNYLKLLPIDYLKLDRSFMQDVMTDERDAAIVTTIAALARSLNIGLVAEGIETKEQADFVIAQNCTELQGFLFSHPLSANAATRLLARQKSTGHAKVA